MRRSSATVVASSASIEVGLPTGAEAVQLVGVPADVQNPVERLEIDDLAEGAAHPVTQFMCLQGLRFPGQDRGGGVGYSSTNSTLDSSPAASAWSCSVAGSQAKSSGAK